MVCVGLTVSLVPVPLVRAAGVTQAIAAAVAAPGFGDVLLRHLSSDHTTLDQHELSKDKRGAESMAALQVRLMLDTRFVGRRLNDLDLSPSPVLFT